MTQPITALLAAPRAIPRLAEGRGRPHIRQPCVPSREPSRMGVALDGFVPRCSLASSSAASTTKRESCWSMLG